MANMRNEWKSLGIRPDSMKDADVAVAAEAGDAEAMNNLGLGLLGQGKKAEAQKWFERAESKSIFAKRNLADLLYGDGVGSDVARAIKLYESVAEFHCDARGSSLHNSECIGVVSLLGWHENTKNAPDYEAAKRWYLIASLHGAEFAAHNVGVLTERLGQGDSVRWFQQAARKGFVGSQETISALYALGEGVPQDLVLAFAWANIAAASGSKPSAELREALPLSDNEKQEGVRLSSRWKVGQALDREVGGTNERGGPPKKSGTGTAFVVSESGMAITNSHVVANCKEVKIEGRDKPIKVVTTDTANDLALLKDVRKSKETAPIVGDVGKLRQGEEIVVFGFPLNTLLSSGGNLTPGVVSALTGLGNNTNQIQITAPIQPGSSGSPVINKKGEVVGVVSMKLDDKKMANATGQIGQNVNFAVNGQTLKAFLDAHKVEYRGGGMFSFGSKSTTDLADEARKWTLVVECWK
ncbi:hypothetical protein MASR1M60_29510 [Rhodocyclaceae bacterium]